MTGVGKENTSKPSIKLDYNIDQNFLNLTIKFLNFNPKGFLNNFLFSGPKLALLFESRTVLNGPFSQTEWPSWEMVFTLFGNKFTSIAFRLTMLFMPFGGIAVAIAKLMKRNFCLALKLTTTCTIYEKSLIFN